MKSQVEIMHEAGFVSASEAATLIGAQHVGTIHRMVKREELEGERVGTHWYVSAASLLKSVDASRTMQDRVTAFMRERNVPVWTAAKGGKIQEAKRGKGKRAAAR